MAKPRSATKKPVAKKAPTAKKVSLKTKATGASVDGFLGKVDAKRRDDVRALDALFQKVVGAPGTMWGSSIVGYGSRVLTYPNGRTMDWMVTGFSPRAANLTLYLGLGDTFAGRDALLARLGPHTTGKGCLYIKRLADVDTKVLAELVKQSVAATR
jgi:hypothetical protein